MSRPFYIAIVSLTASLALAACASTGTALASLRVNPDPSLPPLTSTSLAEWETERASLISQFETHMYGTCLLYTSPSPRDQRGSRMPSSA